jgi:hypothetical protein
MGEIRERGRTVLRYFLVEFNPLAETKHKDKVNELGSIRFYIWLGTCNLTTKDTSVYISLAFSETNDAITWYFQEF